jgi:alcohol dehydrogenase
MTTAQTLDQTTAEARAANRPQTMKAVVFHGPGRKAWEERPCPALRTPTDAIVQITATTICGTDLHILKGDVPTVSEGRILGHEGVGVVREVGAAVTNVRPGDEVLISCITSCARCEYCRRGMYSQCRSGGWVLGHTIDGTQAEYVRIPHADTSLYRLPAGADPEPLVMLSDVLPTGFECGVLNGRVGPGDVVAVVGAGPIGLGALLTAQLYSPAALIAVDGDPNRLEVARALGATAVVQGTDGKVASRILELTAGAGVDVAIEAVGVPASFDVCQSILAPGGRLANVGVHGRPVTLRLDTLWSRNVTLTTRLVDTVTTSLLLKMVQAGRLQPQVLITHRFALSEAMAAYEAFADAARVRALKVLLRRA